MTAITAATLGAAALMAAPAANAQDGNANNDALAGITGSLGSTTNTFGEPGRVVEPRVDGRLHLIDINGPFGLPATALNFVSGGMCSGPDLKPSFNVNTEPYDPNQSVVLASSQLMATRSAVDVQWTNTTSGESGTDTAGERATEPSRAQVFTQPGHVEGTATITALSAPFFVGDDVVKNFGDVLVDAGVADRVKVSFELDVPTCDG